MSVDVEVRTLQALAALTDEGAFEQIATAVLRRADARCAGLSHPGVNSESRTRRSPVDGIAYVPGDPHHMIVVHHTTAAELRSKWLFDPSSRRPRTGSTQRPAGDVVKTAALLAERRVAHPDLRATLILTTNREVDDQLASDVNTAGRRNDLEIEMWTASRLADFLDIEPDGQWIRRKRLGIAQELLSEDLLLELSSRSVEGFTPGDEADKRVSRSLDDVLAANQRSLTFLTASSGWGKSVACLRALQGHLHGGGFAVVLDHEHLEANSSLEQALLAALRSLEPTLTAERAVLSIPTPERPLLVLVEDVSRSTNPTRLIDKLTRCEVAVGIRTGG